MRGILLRSIGALAALLMVSATQAALFNRGNGLIYDDVLDITWMQDANYTFTLAPPEQCSEEGPPGTPPFCIPTEQSVGKMTYDEANAWAADLVFGEYDDWRLPTISPIDGSSIFNTNYTNDATSDEGYAPTTTNGSDGGWRDGGGAPVSEMGYMFYVNLANLGVCEPNLGACVTQAGWGLTETSFFINLAKDDFTNDYWTGTPNGTNKAGYFNFKSGFQGRADTDTATSPDQLYAWAVRDGDVAAVPVPAAVWLFGSALGLLGWMRRKAA
jgi:hypothetical protein